MGTILATESLMQVEDWYLDGLNKRIIRSWKNHPLEAQQMYH